MPCVEETCTIEGNDLNPVTGELIINAKLHDASQGSLGGLACGTEGANEGTYVNRYGQTTAVAAPAFTAIERIGITTGNQLFVEQTEAIDVNLGDGGLIAIPGTGGGASVDSLNVNYTNTSGRAQLVMVHSGRSTASFSTTNGPGEYQFRAVMVQETDISDVTGGTQDRQRVDILAEFTTDNTDIIISEKLSQAVRVTAGATLNIRTFIDVDIRTRLINLGFQSRENYLIIHPTA